MIYLFTYAHDIYYILFYKDVLSYNHITAQHSTSQLQHAVQRDIMSCDTKPGFDRHTVRSFGTHGVKSVDVHFEPHDYGHFGTQTLIRKLLDQKSVHSATESRGRCVTIENPAGHGRDCRLP